MKHFIFDLGGVINKQINNDFGDELVTPKEEYEDIYKEKYVCLEKGDYDFESFIIQIMPYLKHQGHTIKEYETSYLEVYEKYGGLYSQTLEVIKNLKNRGYKVYLLSNLIPYNFEQLKNDFDVSIFDDIFLSYEMHMIKPDIKIYEEVIKKIGDNPENMYFFDDKLKNIEAANRCNINGFVATGENIKEIVSKIMQEEKL